MKVDVREFHRRAAEAFATRVRAIRDGQWQLPTPCTEWDVRDLVQHLVYENRWTPPLMGGATLDEVGDRFEGDLLGRDPKNAWEQSMVEAVNAVRDVPLNRTVHLSYGDVPARHYAFELGTDHLIHAWDLARAIGADETLGDDLAGTLLGVVEPAIDGWQNLGIVAPPVPVAPDADPQTRLIALLGRTP